MRKPDNITDVWTKEYKHSRAVLGFQKFPEYLEWMKQKFPRYDLHHILGSDQKMKFTDALVYPLEHSFHINVVEKRKGYYFFMYRKASLDFFKQWCAQEMGISEAELKECSGYSPYRVRTLIELVHKKIIIKLAYKELQ